MGKEQNCEIKLRETLNSEEREVTSTFLFCIPSWKLASFIHTHIDVFMYERFCYCFLMIVRTQVKEKDLALL